MSTWEPKEGSRGGSEHFHNNVFNESNQGIEMINNGIASIIEKDWDSDDYDAPTILKVCRVCLAMDVKMYYMTDYNLQQMYEQTTGILLGEDKLPQMFCWECAQRLINGSKLRTKALKTQILLTEILNNYECITISGIKSINRTENDLKSSLVKSSYDVNNFNVRNVIYDDDVKCEPGDSRDAFDENIGSQESEETTKKGLQEIEIKDEPIYGPYGSDVDLKLSDTAVEATGRERTVLVKIERVDDHEHITDKYKTSNVKLLPSEGSLDELTITRLKYEEPIAAVEELPDLASYINTIRRNEMSRANLRVDYEPDEPTSDEHVGAPAIRRKKTMKRSKPSNNATDTSLPNISNYSKDRPTSSNSSSQNSITILNLGISKNIRNTSESGPNVNSVVNYNDYFLTNNSNTENDIRKQLPSKCVDVIASCSSLDDKSENNDPKVDNNSEKVKERKYLCHICQSKFTTKGSLNIHMRKHTGDKPYVCDICDYRCSQKCNLNSHIVLKHTKEKNYSCHMCQYKCSRKDYLNVHLRIHTRDKPFRSSQQSDVKSHIKHRHTKEKNYSCHICPYKCVTEGKLNLHLRKHAGDKPYICDICDFRCAEKGNLNNHIKYKHIKEKKYSCQSCQYKCITKWELNLHVRRHTGDKPYICDICDFRCLEKSYLIKHIKFKHTKEKNYSCHICQYKCVTKSTLNVHLRKHTGDKPYICDFCDYRSSHSTNLKKHLISQHSN